MPAVNFKRTLLTTIVLLAVTSSTFSQITDTVTVYRTSTANLKSRHVPNDVFKMKNLRELSIQGMDCDYGDATNCWMIQEIPSEIAHLKKLQVLRLNVNSIQSIPKEITELKELKVLDLTDNSGLSNMDYVTSISSLEEMYLFGCNMKKLPKDIDKLRNLKHLGLTGNNIDKRELDRIRKSLPDCNVTYE